MNEQNKHKKKAIAGLVCRLAAIPVAIFLIIIGFIIGFADLVKNIENNNNLELLYNDLIYKLGFGLIIILIGLISIPILEITGFVLQLISAFKNNRKKLAIIGLVFGLLIYIPFLPFFSSFFNLFFTFSF